MGAELSPAVFSHPSTELQQKLKMFAYFYLAFFPISCSKRHLKAQRDKAPSCQAPSRAPSAPQSPSNLTFAFRSAFFQTHHYFGCICAVQECRCFLCSHQHAHALVSEGLGRLLVRVLSRSRRHLRKMWMQFRHMTRETTHLHALACKCNLGRQRAELA